MPILQLDQIVDRLQAHYGRPKAPAAKAPWELILWENIAYLADDARRLQAFRMLEKQVGLEPIQILDADEKALVDVCRHGILAENQAKKLRRCAEIVLKEFDGDLRTVVAWPGPKAKRALKKFPGIGEPGAEKILLFSRRCALLAPESNALRVLVRLGYAEERKSYSTMYRLVQEAIKDQLPSDFDWLIRTHQLLRQHGQELCRRSSPKCDECPLAAVCAYATGGQNG